MINDQYVKHPLSGKKAKYRQGHFDGVVNVVKRLLDICHPDYLLMGQKDYQQQYIINDMIQGYGLTVKLVTCPIVREDDGLAFSSRNVRLTPMYRRASSCLYESLNWIKDHINEFEVPYLLEHGGANH